MNPKITVKFRRRNGVPYAIEQFTGKQFRCRHCNKIFFDITELERHIVAVSNAKKATDVAVDSSTPQLNQMLEVKIGYVYDIADFIKRRYLRLEKNETYDGITFHKIEGE